MKEFVSIDIFVFLLNLAFGQVGEKIKAKDLLVIWIVVQSSLSVLSRVEEYHIFTNKIYLPNSAKIKISGKMFNQPIT